MRILGGSSAKVATTAGQIDRFFANGIGRGNLSRPHVGSVTHASEGAFLVSRRGRTSIKSFI